MSGLESVTECFQHRPTCWKVPGGKCSFIHLCAGEIFPQRILVLCLVVKRLPCLAVKPPRPSWSHRISQLTARRRVGTRRSSGNDQLLPFLLIGATTYLVARGGRGANKTRGGRATQARGRGGGAQRRRAREARAAAKGGGGAREAQATARGGALGPRLQSTLTCRVALS